MSDMSKEDLKEILGEVLNERRKIDDDKHTIHHEFIQLMMEKHNRNEARWERFQSSFIGGIALAMLGFLGWIGNLILDHFHLMR